MNECDMAVNEHDEPLDEPLHEWLDAQTADPAADAGVHPAHGSASDDQLIAWLTAIVDHDERALSALYDATASRVYTLVHQIVRSRATAEEVMEDVFFQVWRQVVRFDAARGRPMTWILSMARSRAIDAWRRESRFDAASLDVEPRDDAASLWPSMQPDADRQAMDHRRLHAAMARLSAQGRQMIALSFFRGLSHEEIAQHTRLPLGTVKTQIRRALAALREQLGSTSCSTRLSVDEPT